MSLFIAISICISLDCKYLLTELIANNISYQMLIPYKNSKFLTSYVAKQLASFLVLGLSLDSTYSIKAFCWVMGMGHPCGLGLTQDPLDASPEIRHVSSKEM